MDKCVTWHLDGTWALFEINPGHRAVAIADDLLVLKLLSEVRRLGLDRRDVFVCVKTCF